MTRIPAHAIIAALIIAASLLVAPALASEGAPSTIPHAFYGQVYGPDGSNAPAGSIIVASVAGNEAGTILVGPAGAYGTAYGGGAKLVVWTPALQPGENITFYIDGVRAAESALFESGGVTNLTLTASAALPKERPGESTTRPVNATGGQSVIVDGGGASAVLTTTGDFQGETIVFTLFTSSPDDQPVPPGTRDVGRFAEITSTIGNDNIQKVIVRVHYTDADVVGIDESSIRVYWWSTTGAWEQLPGGVDTGANVAWGETDHFSTFGLFGAAPKPSPGGGGSGGAVPVVTPDTTVTPVETTAVEATPAQVDAPETGAPLAAVTGTPGAAAPAEDEPVAGAAEPLPVAAVVLIVVAIGAAGFLLLRRT
jgi:hypothetical protein